MVLPRETPAPVWGWAGPGEPVTVTFHGQTKSATADARGKWSLKLDALAASSESHTLTVFDSLGHRLEIHDILVGDVWLCSGQSNMGMGMRDALNGQQEIDGATFPLIRLFSVGTNPSLTPETDVKGRWDVCTPQSVPNFSAAAYFFGRELHRNLNIPIGLLHSSVGGTPAEAWTRLDALRTLPAAAARAEDEIRQIQSQEEDSKSFPARRAAWEQKHGVAPPPVADASKNWADPALDTADWKTVTLPGRWAQFGAKSGGVFWLRKTVLLPESAAGRPFALSLNWVSEQYDTAFFNGREVGRASDSAPGFYNVQRSYKVPGELVKPGPNVIAVRIVSATQHAGMWQWGNGLGAPVAVRGSIDNQWAMKTECEFPPLGEEALQSRPRVNNLPFRSVSSALYHGMIAPLVPFAIKGIVWYQGESNVPRSAEYFPLLSLLIRDWRAQWGRGNFPFLIQQLVNNGPPSEDPSPRGGWPLLREAQMRTSESVPQCGIAVGIELGDPLTIHPANKQEVGRRLALVALEKVYGKPLESSGPRFESMHIEGAVARIKFRHGAGLAARNGPPRQFAIAGADRKFVRAEAEISGSEVLVRHPDIPRPAAVRYAWADNPAPCNLFNAAGLPAAPFRTDDWQ